jgi:predicted phage terminase large subunit-like protein
MSRTSNPQRQPTPLHSAPEVYRYALPPLHTMQQQVALDPARFKVVVCGRQWGKTVLGAIKCIEEAVAGGHVWWVAPTFPIGQLGWDIIDHLCRQIVGTRFEGRPIFKITLPTGGTIQLRSSDNPDSLRGATLSGVVFDEAAQAKPEAWPYLRPTLSVRKGWAMFISTPKGLNWFHDLYEDASGREGWARWTFPSTSSPYIDESDLADAKSGMSSLLYSQEYEAQFISYGSGMFHADWIQHYALRHIDGEDVFMLRDVPVLANDCWYFHTVDLAWTLSERSDFTVISTWAVTPSRQLVLRDVIRGRFEGPDIIPQMRFAQDRYGGVMYVERANRQMMIVQEAERQGINVKEVRADKDKIARALPATAKMERGQVWFPPASTPWYPDIEEELLAFPASRHDDFVDTLAYACQGVQRVSAYEDHAPISE